MKRRDYLITATLVGSSVAGCPGAGTSQQAFAEDMIEEIERDARVILEDHEVTAETVSLEFQPAATNNRALRIVADAYADAVDAGLEYDLDAQLSQSGSVVFWLNGNAALAERVNDGEITEQEYLRELHAE